MLSVSTSTARTSAWRFSAPDPTDAPIDPNGNLASKTEDGHSWTYEWNARNELTRVLKDSVEVARFGYDAGGRRVEKVLSGSTTSYVYAHAEILRQVTGVSSVRYVQGIGTDEPLAAENGAGQLTYEHADGLGSEVKQTDGGGVIVLSRSYDAFGQMQLGAMISGTAFTAREWDAEDQLQYSRARYYDPKTGRFVSEDPIGFNGGANFYAYVANNPVRDVDPDGLFPRNPRTPDFVHCLQDPVACARKYVCTERADKMTMRVFHDDTDGTPANAFKHCFWSCCIAKEVGMDRAMKAVEAHEMIPNNPVCHLRMDTHNNAKGSGAGELYPTVGCRTLCLRIPLQGCPVGSCSGGGAGSGAPSGPGSASGNGPASGPGPASQ